jgi:hypothetical protein
MRSIYDPETYPEGVPNPFGPRVHAWKGGPRNEGTRYHGPVYARPDYRLPWQRRPLWGVGAEAAEWGTDVADLDTEIDKMERSAWIKGMFFGAALTLVGAAIYRVYTKKTG